MRWWTPPIPEKRRKLDDHQAVATKEAGCPEASKPQHSGKILPLKRKPAVAPLAVSTQSGASDATVSAPPLFYQHTPVISPCTQPIAPSLFWLETEAPPEEGLPRTGPALYHNESMKSLVSTAHSILSEFVDIESQVVLFHDHDWSELPLVCKGLRAAGGEEVAICLAVCVSRKVWAVGLAGKQKVRVNTARLALAVALAWNGDCAHVALRWPEFANLCSAAGVHFEAGPADTRGTSGHGTWRGHPSFGAKTTPSTQAVSVPRVPALPVETAPTVDTSEIEVWWIEIPEESWPVPLAGVTSRDAVIIAHSTNTGLSELQQSASLLLRELVEDTSHVTFHHDCSWDSFPSVGAALRSAGGKEESLCVAVCEKFDLWAVGLGSKWKTRQTAAKLSLCVAITLKTSEFDATVAKWREFRAFREHVRGRLSSFQNRSEPRSWPGERV
uniref:Uncharacterized protein n=1 Tax=Noctiluca scintillans TaxID=2966 RepID=A0A7S1EWI5_NOCSC|mmetsp:Transcript_12964/g.35836  ORF Transcript_12964/g.35836 Transcript_12964/m.35836 type:complete len:443 (+) Transcript_12964:3-1331(+)